MQFFVELLVCIVINESWVARQLRYLASSVTPAKVVAECDEWRCVVEGDDGVSSKQCDETGHEKHEDRYVGPTLHREDGGRIILSHVNTWVRIMERRASQRCTEGAQDGRGTRKGASANKHNVDLKKRKHTIIQPGK